MMATSNLGPLARLKEVLLDPSTMGVLVQRLTEGQTLREIAKAWEVPYGKLCEWIAEDRVRAEKYSQALRFAAESYAHEVVPIADGATPEDVAVRKLKIQARQWVAGKWDRARYGELGAAVNVEVTTHVALDRDAMLLETARGYALVLEDAGRTIDAAPQAGQVLLAPLSQESRAAGLAAAAPDEEKDDEQRAQFAADI